MHCVQNGYNKIQVRTVHTDVVVLAISLCDSLQTLKELFVTIETGRHFKIIPGCDTTSGFSGKGKKSCWDALKAYPTSQIL